MLVIRRRLGEAILLGDHVEVQILEIAGSRVKLGVLAPAHVAVLRKEAVEARRHNLVAAACPMPAEPGAWAQALRDVATGP